MKPARLAVGLILTAWMSSAMALNAQEPAFSKNNLWWINVGAGFSSGDKEDFGWPGLGLSYSNKSKIGLLTFRANYFEEFNLCIFGPCSAPARIWEAGGLYGIIKKGKLTSASAGAGISLVSGRREGEKTFTTVGLPLETQLFFTPFDFAGVGLYGLADLNPEKSFWAALFCLQFGNLK